VSDMPIDWRREYADLADELERVAKVWRCPEPTCRNGHIPDTFSSAWPPGLKPCPHHKRVREHVEHGRRVLGRETR
jgi:hypothetical protein